MGMAAACCSVFPVSVIAFAALSTSGVASSVCEAMSQSESVLICKELIELDTQIDTYFVETDEQSLASVVTDDFLWVHAGALLIHQGRDAIVYLSEVPDGIFLSRMERSHYRVQVYEGVVIVSGFMAVKFRPEAYTQFHIQRAYIKSKGHWKLASQHGTLVAKE